MGSIGIASGRVPDVRRHGSGGRIKLTFRSSRDALLQRPADRSSSFRAAAVGLSRSTARRLLDMAPRAPRRRMELDGRRPGLPACELMTQSHTNPEIEAAAARLRDA